MIKKALGWLLGLMAGWFDHETSVENVREFVEKHYRSLALKQNLPEETRNDMAQLRKLLLQLGWQAGEKADLNVKEKEKTGQAPLDFADLNPANCFERGVLRPGCGRYLDQFSTANAERDVLMQRLLRHVEVKRQASLQKFSQELPAEAQWLERCDISILFSHYARRTRDLRFLNAAFKLDEWNIKMMRRSLSDAGRVRLLLALAEQEISAKELLAC